MIPEVEKAAAEAATKAGDAKKAYEAENAKVVAAEGVMQASEKAMAGAAKALEDLKANPDAPKAVVDAATNAVADANNTKRVRNNFRIPL